MARFQETLRRLAMIDEGFVLLAIAPRQQGVFCAAPSSVSR